MLSPEMEEGQIRQAYNELLSRCQRLEKIIELNDISGLAQIVSKYQNNSKELLKQIAMILPTVEYAPEETKELVKLIEYLEGVHEKLDAYVIKSNCITLVLDRETYFGAKKAMRTVSFLNRKGGVGKTTLSTNFAYAIYIMFKDSGLRILFIDNDAQGSASDWFEADKQHGTMADVLMGKVSMRKAIQHTRYEGIDLIAADASLSEANDYLLRYGNPQDNSSFSQAWHEIAEDYDLCIIDNPPDMNFSVLEALSVTDDVVIVTFPEEDSLAGAREIMGQIKQAKKFNHPLKLSGILVNAFSGNQAVHRCIEDMRNKHLPVFRTKIHYATLEAKNCMNLARRGKKSIFEVSPSCVIARDIFDFSKEYLGVAE